MTGYLLVVHALLHGNHVVELSATYRPNDCSVCERALRDQLGYMLSQHFIARQMILNRGHALREQIQPRLI